MSKKIVGILVVLLLLLAPLGSVYAYETFRGHTGVVIYDKDALDVYTLFAGFNETVSYLIDMKGNVVHDWKLAELIPMTDAPSGPTDTAYFDGPQVQAASSLTPGLHDRLLPNGNLLRGYKPDTYDYTATPGTPGEANVDATTFKVGYSPAGGTSGGVLELDWKGNLLWYYPLKDAMHIQHHTFYRVVDAGPYQGHTFLLGWELIDPATATAGGRDPATIGAGSGAPRPLAAGIYPDFIREVDANKNIVWEWRTWDHIAPDADMTNPHKFWVNAQTFPVNQSDADWTHGNTVEFNPVTDQVIINFRNWGEFFIIDHAATYDPTCSTSPGTCDPYTLAASDAGDITFRWGNPGNYGAGTLPYFLNDGDQVIFGEHCVVWLGVDYQNEAGTAGNVLIFDNGWQRPAGNRSSSVEMTPDPTSFGIAGVGTPANWLTPALGGNSPEVWRFSSRNESAFYTAYQGGTGRLLEDAATGEMWTFVTSTGEGQLFQVYTNESGQNSVVWDYEVPALDAEGNRRCYHDDGTNNMIHRAHQYLPTYAGLAGKKLEVQYPMSGNCTQFYDLWDSTVVAGSAEAPPPLTGWGFTGTGIGGGGGGGGGGAGGGGGGY